MTYQAPVDDIMHALKAAAGLDGLIADGVLEGVDEETVRAVVAEAGKFAAEVLEPLDTVGDRTGSKLVDGKVTYVHRRLWPALVRLSDRLGRRRLAKLEEEHTEEGFHRTRRVPFPKWVPKDVRALAAKMTEAAAEAALPEGVVPR